VRTQLPFDVTSEGVLSGDIGGSTDSAEAPRFSVVLAHKLP
jgi:citrate lyase alpha subunit